jgi:hypothetical protein
MLDPSTHVRESGQHSACARTCSEQMRAPWHSKVDIDLGNPAGMGAVHL